MDAAEDKQNSNQLKPKGPKNKKKWHKNEVFWSFFDKNQIDSCVLFLLFCMSGKTWVMAKNSWVMAKKPLGQSECRILKATISYKWSEVWSWTSVYVV